MKRHLPCSTVAVRLLTPVLILALGSCALTQQYILDRCNSRAYVRTVLSDYLSTRFHSQAPVRLAVVPFSVPANLAPRGTELPGMGNQLAWQVQAELVAADVVPIVEVLNRQDWPGKKSEFNTGNFQAISIARDAGYDLVLVGKVHPTTSPDRIVFDSKLIETESGITLWFATTSIESHARGVNQELSGFGFDKEKPSLMDTDGLMRDAAQCLVREMVGEDA